MKKQKYSITIILPVYNGEKYLARCIDSVVGQTLDGVKLLAINDGSTDRSLAILEKYKKLYPGQIDIIDQENMGVAKTRNKGISLTETEYLTFIDQDDFLDLDFCETLYEEAGSGDYDLVLSGYRRPGASLISLHKNMKLGKTKYARFRSIAIWGKLHKTSFVKEKGILVFDTAMGEDIVFSLREYKHAKMKVMNNYIGYNWFYNGDSVSNTKQKSMSVMLPSLFMLLDEIRENDDGTKEYAYFSIQTLVYFILWTGHSASKVEFMNTYKEIINFTVDKFENLFRGKFIIMQPRGTPIINRIATSLFLIFVKTNTLGLFASIYCKGK